MSYRKYREEINRYIRKYKETHPCVDCGETAIELLEFDHIDPSTKKFSVSNYRHNTTKFDNVVAEIDKCEMRCVRCHRKRTLAERHHLLLNNRNPILGILPLFEFAALRQAAEEELRSARKESQLAKMECIAAQQEFVSMVINHFGKAFFYVLEEAILQRNCAKRAGLGALDNIIYQIPYELH
jgi:hypothetical protein